MTIAADVAALDEPPHIFLRRWGMAFFSIITTYGAAVAGMLYLNSKHSVDGPPPAPIMLTLAAFPASTTLQENDLAPGPKQVKSDAAPAPDRPLPLEPMKSEKAEIPRPEKKVARERKLDLPAPVNSAPQAAPVLAEMAGAPVAGMSAHEAEAIMNWQARLRAHLEGYKRYPHSAQMRGEKGVATLRFIVDRKGRVISSSLARSSGYAELDKETLNMIRRAEPLPAMPEELPDRQKAFTIPVRFGAR